MKVFENFIIQNSQLGENLNSIRLICNSLCLNGCITTLILSSNSLLEKAENISLFSEVFNKNPINDLTICSDKFDKKGESMRILCDSLKNNKTLTQLDLSDTKNIQNMEYLTSMLETNTIISHLDLSNCSLGNNFPNVMNLSKIIENNCFIKVLNLQGNDLFRDKENTKIFCSSLKKTQIQKISFYSNKIESNIQNIELFVDLGKFLASNHKEIKIDIGRLENKTLIDKLSCFDKYFEL